LRKWPTLYTRAKTGKIQQWTISTDGCFVTVRHGQVGGKTQENIYTAEGKNQGRSNETTPAEQAEKEAEAKYVLKVDKGAFLTLEEAESDAPPKHLLPTKALKVRDHIKKLIGQEVGFQPKLDGYRCTSYWNKNRTEVLLKSKTGKLLDLPHLKKTLERDLPKNGFADGEVFIGNLMVDCKQAGLDINPFQIVSALIKKQQTIEIPELGAGYTVSSSNLEYHVYDYVDLEQGLQEGYRQREKQIIDLCNHDGNLFQVATYYQIFTEELLEKVHKKLTSLHYEGTIVRVLGHPYEFGFRSMYLLKYKDFLEGEFKVIGFTEGKGTKKGAVIWECLADNGETFTCAMTGSIESQREYFRNGNQYIGRMLTVKYQELTSKGVPKFQTGKAIRETWDM